MRLPNGYGSVYKLSGKRRKPWIVVISHGINAEGKVDREPIGYYKTRQEGLSALAEYHREPQYMAGNKKTLGEVVQDFFEYKASSKDISAAYKASLRKLAPLYRHKFKHVTAHDLQLVMDSTTPSVSHTLKAAIKGLYKFAMMNGYVSTNLADALTPQDTDKSTLHYPFTPEEIHELWQYAGDFTADMALILIFTGMRIGELLTIKNSNIHEDYMIGGIKTKAGKNRVIPIHDAIKPIIHRYQSSKELFISMSAANFRGHYWRNSGIPCLQKHTPHDGRHTCETMLNNAGVNKVIIQKIIGHAGNDVDDSVYTHKTNEQLIEAINVLPTYQ